MRNQETLTADNMNKASTVVSKKNPEWGTFRFNMNAQPLPKGEVTHTIGSGSHSKVLFENEFKFWDIATYTSL